ncbi:MAG: GNAT family N-acetyltransferase [Cyanobacteria bacterium P01_A01_bin.84]
MSNFEYSTPEENQELKPLGEILAQCFLGSPEEEEKYLHLIGLENIRVLHQGNKIVGGLGTIPMSQWWGGKKVSMTGIGGVGIAPEYRGSGAAVSLMQETIKELYTQGVSTSALYPAVQKLYRKVGYEQAGSRFIWEIPTHSIEIRDGIDRQILPLVSIALEEDNSILELIRDLYVQEAQSINGHLKRHSLNWYKVVKPYNKEKIYGYLFGSLDQPEGYIIFRQYRKNDTSFLGIRDWIVLTKAAAYTFWNLLKNHSSQIDKLRWCSSSVDSLTLLLPEQNANIYPQRWMLRIVNVIKALSERGYPKKLEAELHLQVEDDLIAENNGKFILEVKDGWGKVRRGGKGEMKLSINGLATIYSGLFSAYQLKVLGKLDAPSVVIDDASQIFAGTTPWMRDFF